MRINRILKRTLAEGPGLRFCIWVQGCPHRCEDCFSRETWDKNGGYESSADEIIAQLAEVENEIRGITLLGGEPFEQAEELLPVAEYAKSKGLDIIAFTGYTYEALKKKDNALKLLELIDLLIDGRYEKDKQDFSRPLAGSSNQRFIYLGSGIKQSEIEAFKNRFEIRVDENGKVYFNGMGDIEAFKEYLNRF